MTPVSSPAYELWDAETGNLIADYADEDAACLAVRAGVDDDGPEARAMVPLVRVELGEKRTPCAEGVALVALARGGATTADRREGSWP
jgi:hypothetical protein